MKKYNLFRKMLAGLTSIFLVSMFFTVETKYYTELKLLWGSYELPNGKWIYLTHFLLFDGSGKELEQMTYESDENTPVIWHPGNDRFDTPEPISPKSKHRIELRNLNYLKPEGVKIFASAACIANRKRIENILNRRLAKQINAGTIQGEQWYRDSKGWFMIAFCNPVHYKYPNNELIILNRHSAEIFPHVKNLVQVHYGIGVGETELEIVRWQLEFGNNAEIKIIDVNPDFLDLFANNLAAKQIEYPNQEIKCHLIKSVFQKTTRKNLNIVGKQGLHICFGNTIGNFRMQGEIFEIFKKNSVVSDKLLLGFQLNTHSQETLEKYRTNPYFPTFVLNQVVKNGIIDAQKINWQYETKTGFITMNYGTIEAFRSKKYAIADLVKELDFFSFRCMGYWVDEYQNNTIMLSERV